MERSQEGVPAAAQRPSGSDAIRSLDGAKTASRRRPGTSAQRRRLRPRGSGGVLAVRTGVWRIDVEAPRDPETGKRRRSSRFVYGTREEAELALAQLRVVAHQRRLPAGRARPRSVRAVLDAYVKEAESGRIELAPSTVVTSRSASRTMAETRLSDGTPFGDLRLAALTWERIEDLYAAMRSSGRGPDWVRRCATVLSRALEQVRKRGVIEANPCRDATRPKSVRTKPFAPSASEVRKLIELVSGADPEVGDAAFILAATGMRRGELLGLFWEDVDLVNGEVHVAAALTDGGRGVGLVRKATKRSDWRDVPLTSGAVAAFERQSARRASFAGQSPARIEYVFAGDVDGTVPMRPELLGHRWNLASGNIAVNLLHLRHFAATAMLDAGESYRTVADINHRGGRSAAPDFAGRTGASPVTGRSPAPVRRSDLAASVACGTRLPGSSFFMWR